MCSLDRSTEQTRARMLIDDVVQRLHLDLRGLVVLTEIASGAYVYSPFIAALAGSERVFATGKDSPYGSRREVFRQGMRLAGAWSVRDRVLLVDEVSPDVIAQADIVTNLSALRPIDGPFISHLKPGAVIPYMRESWEYRKEDVDLAACRLNNVPVMGTNENYGDLGVFDLCGPLAAKMIFEAGLEVASSHIVVAGHDKFGDVIVPYLRECRAKVYHVRERMQLDLNTVKRVDALLVACFDTDELIVGAGGWFDPSELAKHHPECTVIQFAGDSDTEALRSHGVRCIPHDRLGPRRMARTFAFLGTKPVIDLHAAGLRVGELMWREMRALDNAQRVETVLGKRNDLCQSMRELL
jgi:hypothetical protein